MFVKANIFVLMFCGARIAKIGFFVRLCLATCRQQRPHPEQKSLQLTHPLKLSPTSFLSLKRCNFQYHIFASSHTTPQPPQNNPKLEYEHCTASWNYFSFHFSILLLQNVNLLGTEIKNIHLFKYDPSTCSILYCTTICFFILLLFVDAVELVSPSGIIKDSSHLKYDLEVKLLLCFKDSRFHIRHKKWSLMVSAVSRKPQVLTICRLECYYAELCKILV